MGSGALEGLLVADFSRVLAGPYATMLACPVTTSSPRPPAG
ncbi:hypothetical protein [Actinomadura sp. NTSP31]